MKSTHTTPATTALKQPAVSVSGFSLQADKGMALVSKALQQSPRTSAENNQPEHMEHMKKNNTSKIICAATLVLTSLTTLIALADSQMDPAKTTTGTNTCCGKYYAYARMTNELGSTWIKPPTNIVVTSGTLTDISGFSSPYSSYASALKFGTPTPVCGSNSVTFPATNTSTYQLSVYVTSQTPPPTNNEPVVLQITWQ